MPEKGLKTLLKKLKNNGYIRGIGTNRTNTMEKVLKDFDLEEFFEVVITAAKVKNPKPDPEQLLLIMEKFDLEPRQILFVGDSDYDRQAAVPQRHGRHIGGYLRLRPGRQGGHPGRGVV